MTIVSTKYDPKKSALFNSVKHLSKGEGHDDILEKYGDGERFIKEYS